MKPAPYARLVFGASAVLFGVLCLMWWDADTWQGMSAFWKLPFGRPVGAAVMLAEIAGGVLLVIPRTVRLAAIVLGVAFAAGLLLILPGLVTHPDGFFRWYGLLQQILLLGAALAAYAATEPDAARTVLLVRIAQTGLGFAAAIFAAAHVLYLNNTTVLVPAWLPPNPTFWAYLTAACYGLAALAALVDRQATLAMRLMALMMGLFALLVWVPRLIAQGSHNDWSEFAYTLLFTGATWVIAEARAARA